MDGDFRTLQMDIPLKSKETLSIVPVSDIHRDSAMCDVDRWRDFCKHYRKFKGKIMFILLGDYNDFASTSERRALKSIKLHGDTTDHLENFAMRNTKLLLKEIDFMKGRTIGVLDGNHRWDFENGLSDGEVIARELGSTYLGHLAYVRLRIILDNRTRSGVTFDLFVSHGKSSGKLAGNTINRVDDMKLIFPQADFYCMGHDHRKAATPVTILKAVSGNGGLIIKQQDQWLCRSGSFLKGYVENKNSYVAGMLLRPTALGTIELKLKVERSCKNGNDVLHKSIKVEY